LADFDIWGLLFPAFWQPKTPNFVVSGLRHFVMSPDGGDLTKLNTDAQLQTFPYRTV